MLYLTSEMVPKTRTTQPSIFAFNQSKEIITHVREEYSDELEFLWPRSPKNAVWRNKQNQKWYGLLMTIRRSKLGQNSSEEVEIIDLRFPKGEALDFASSTTGVYPGYHMNKNNWITIILDDSIETVQVLDLLAQSYMISLKA